MPDAEVVNVYGCPGSGKTRHLVDAFVRFARLFGGPDRVAAVTYTRAAAQEFRERAAAALGLRARPEHLQAAMPWVGTIHGLCYRLLDRPKMVSRQKLGEFAALHGLAWDDGLTDWEEKDTALDSEFGDDKLLSLALRLRAAAAHRMSASFLECLDAIPQEQRARHGDDMIVATVNDYLLWKARERLIDFEDLLHGGAYKRPPVHALLLDEAQDQSPLLWRVVNAWERGLRAVIRVGDPWQALYVYMGADPGQFRQQPGRWVSLGQSHRLTSRATNYATRVLLDAGWVDPLITSWRGVGPGSQTDGSYLYLARTHRLVSVLEKDLIRSGIPFARLNGRAPLETRAADAWVALREAGQGRDISGERALALARTLKRPASDVSTAQRWARTDEPVTPDDLGRLGIAPAHLSRIAWHEYLTDVVRQFGEAALHEPPKVRLGTIHAAKGREADFVTVLRAWGDVPGRALDDPEQARLEACIAYVATSRHRVSLTFLEGGHGREYPFA